MEYEQLNRWLIGAVAAVIHAYFWGLGGRSEKVLGMKPRFWRRWVAPLWWSSFLILESIYFKEFQWFYLVMIPAYKAQTHQGYGDKKDRGWFKVIRRLLWSLGYASCSIIIPVLTGRWLIWAAQTGVSCICSIIFGAFNPIKDAPSEESTICLSSSFILPTIFRG